jgi:hypothetical protein
MNCKEAQKQSTHQLGSSVRRQVVQSQTGDADSRSITTCSHFGLQSSVLILPSVMLGYDSSILRACLRLGRPAAEIRLY